MNSPGRLLVVGFDGSRHGDAALRWTLGVAAQPGDRVQVVVVRPAEALLPGTSFALQPPGRRPGADYDPRDRIAALRREFPGAPEVTITTPHGDPATELVTTSTESDLLVVGSHGTGLARELLLGSVSRDCVRYSRCPVVVITPGAARRLAPAAAESGEAST